MGKDECGVMKSAARAQAEVACDVPFTEQQWERWAGTLATAGGEEGL